MEKISKHTIKYFTTFAFLSSVSLHQLNHDSEALQSPEILEIHLPHALSYKEECGFLHHLKGASTLEQQFHDAQSKPVESFQLSLHNLDNQPGNLWNNKSGSTPIYTGLENCTTVTEKYDIFLYISLTAR